MSKHVKVLENAGLITRGRKAQLRPSRLEGRALHVAADWLKGYSEFWEGTLDRLGRHLDQIKKKGPKDARSN